MRAAVHPKEVAHGIAVVNRGCPLDQKNFLLMTCTPSRISKQILPLALVVAAVLVSVEPLQLAKDKYTC